MSKDIEDFKKNMLPDFKIEAVGLPLTFELEKLFGEVLPGRKILGILGMQDTVEVTYADAGRKWLAVLRVQHVTRIE